MAPPLARALNRRAAAALAGAAILASALFMKTRFDPRCAFLSSRPPANWIRVPRPAALLTHVFVPRFARFRATVDAPRSIAATLAARARAESEFFLDGVEILSPGAPPDGWKGERRAPLSVQAGRHEVLAVVRAVDGPPLLWAQVPELGLYTGAGWEASVDGGKSWSPAQDARTPLVADEFSSLPGAAQGFRRTLPWLLPFLLLGAWLPRRFAGSRSAALERLGLFAGAAAWLVLAAAALAMLPQAVGYDAGPHVDYAGRLARTGALPGPGDGWQTFQAPLYYLLSAPLWILATKLGQEPATWLKLPNLLSGFALGLASRRFVGAARPKRPDLALAACVFGWFWAANLLGAQTPGNEPLAGALSALFLAECVRRGAGNLRGRDAAVLGALLGAALLAKFTAILAIPPALYLLKRPLVRAPRAGAARWAGAFVLCLFAAGGWFYLRTWVLYGAPFVGGWDPARGISWWQDPGVRSAGDLCRFGSALIAPFYSGLNGFWDALYSTFWTDGWQSGMISLRALPPRPLDWQAAGAWWGLLPTALIARGAARALRRDDAPSGAALLGAAGGVAALLWLFLSVPTYSTVKASYLLGLAPLFALLLADGLDGLTVPSRAAAWAGLIGWAAAAFRAALPL
ncbi:MAG: hypothetical protein ACHQ49_05620 [Elusimicrobiota bacterium]